MFSKKDTHLVDFDASLYEKYGGCSIFIIEERLTLSLGFNSLKQEDFEGIRRYFSEMGQLENLTLKFKENLIKHGLFCEKFFLKNIRQELVEFILANISKAKEVIDKYHQHGKYNEPLAKDLAIAWIEQLLIELILFENQQEFMEISKNWLEKTSVRQICPICRREYRVRDFPYWVYYGSNGFTGCCFNCDVMEFPEKELLSVRVKNFVDSCGFIPNSDLSPINNSFMSRVNKGKMIPMLINYTKMGGIEHVKEIFKTWFEALVYSGVLQEGVQVLSRGIRCIAEDGHVCNSLDEMNIDNWLFHNKIKHSKEPFYPQDDEFNKSGKRRADWLIGDTYIEYFGLKGENFYDQKTLEKFSLADKKGFKLIGIFPEDIPNIENILSVFK